MIYKKSWKYTIIKDDSTEWWYNNEYFRIKSLKSFSNISKGDLGGFVKGFYNLSQSGDCWIYNKAKVIRRAIVSENARIYDYAIVTDNAKITGHAMVSKNARITGDAQVLGKAHVYGNATVTEKAVVSGNAKVSGNALVRGKAQVCGCTRVSRFKIINE
jgi:tetrahydrodipicolinate N-succinyltransferase